ncbi:MAG: ABC transporter ATP-binding protein [Chloroflexota bacterium]|nr:ABC transporter ATP-binding protein [Chloroflexota bacterium]
MIELRGILKVYRAGDVPVVALDHIDLDIARGEMLSIIGASGSGKSTLMNILGCLDKPTRGTYTLEGRNVNALSDRQLARLRGRRIGFVFQSFNLLSRMTALEQVELPLIYLGVRNRRRLAMRALASVGLADRWHHKPTQLSGGQQQRVAIARALVTNPAIIMADEPTGALDTKTTKAVMETLVRLNAERGITVILVTHELDVAAYTRRVITLRDGNIISDAAPGRTNVVAFPSAETRREPAPEAAGADA